MIHVSKETEDFIQYHLSQRTPIDKLLLKASSFPHVDVRFAVHQIEGRQKAKYKLPTFFANPKVVYPSRIAIEQCSSELTALLKAKFLGKGTTLLDLTGGFGIDTWAFAKYFNSVFYIEKNAELAKIARSNFEAFQLNNVTVIEENGIEWLKNFSHFRCEVIYIDPSRRNEHQKIVSLEDSEPNIIAILPELFKYASRLLIKASPMLDIQKAIQQLRFVHDIAVVSVENECKEILFLLKPKNPSSINLHVFVYKNDLWDSFSCNFEELGTASKEIPISLPKRYLYEPDTAYTKTKAFIHRYKNTHALLHRNSVLLTSDALDTLFVGRAFEIEKILSWKELQKERISRANIATRNYPLCVEQIRKQTRIQEGGDIYLFATTLMNNKKVFIKCKKIY